MQHIKHIWPTVKDLASDLDVPYTTAHSWSVRGRIPPDYDLKLIRLAKRRGKKLTLSQLAEARDQSANDDTHNASSVDVAERKQDVACKNTAGAAT